jgi:hypothetical protein
VTGELSPAGGQDPGRPELRASHEDRDRVVELLRVAAGDGRLTADELDERLEAALTARTQRELVVLTADLPAAPGAPHLAAPSPEPQDVIRMKHRGGNAQQIGQWIVPRRMEIQSTGGNVRLDFSQAVITAPVLQIEAEVKGGNFVIVTRPGVVVDTGGIEMVGGAMHLQPPRYPPPPTILRIEISGRVLGGNLRTRGPRRTFWQWLFRRPWPGTQPAIRP